jgi:hypothetical protein
MGRWGQGKSPIDAVKDEGPKGEMSWKAAMGINCGRRLLTKSSFSRMKTRI